MRSTAFSWKTGSKRRRNFYGSYIHASCTREARASRMQRMPVQIVTLEFRLTGTQLLCKHTSQTSGICRCTRFPKGIENMFRSMRRLYRRGSENKKVRLDAPRLARGPNHLQLACSSRNVPVEVYPRCLQVSVERVYQNAIRGARESFPNVLQDL